MKKVVIWGVAGIFANYYSTIDLLAQEMEIDIIGLIDKSLSGKSIMIDNKPCIVCQPSELDFSECDHLVIAAKNAFKNIVEEAKTFGISEDKCIFIGDFAKNFTQINKIKSAERKRQFEIIQEILRASDDEITDYNWMFEHVGEFGVHCFSDDWMSYSGVNWTDRGYLQVPEEFTQYLCMLGQLKNIKTAIEIGVFAGLSSYIICAVLSRNNPELEYTLVDIVDVLEDYEDFAKLLPALRKRIPSTSTDYIGQQYDFVFIDADHSYDASIADYENLGKYANTIVTFHDIYAHEYDSLNGGTVRMWQEVKCQTMENPSYEIKEFSKYPNKWMGIGCIIKNS